MPRRLAQQRMTLSDFEWPFHASRAISAVAEPCYFLSAELVSLYTSVSMSASYDELSFSILLYGWTYNTLL